MRKRGEPDSVLPPLRELGPDLLYIARWRRLLAALLLATWGQTACERELRGWYERHHGVKVVD
jgi:hypothetical protein